MNRTEALNFHPERRWRVVIKEQYRTMVKQHDFYPALFAIGLLIAIPIFATIFG